MTTCSAEFELNFKVKTSKGRILPAAITKEADVYCHTRVEECHGFHTFYDIDNRHYDQRLEELTEEFEDLELLEEALLDELQEDETVIEII